MGLNNSRDRISLLEQQYLSSIQLCKMSLADTAIVGYKVKVISSIFGDVSERTEGQVNSPAICEEEFKLPFGDCLTYLHLTLNSESKVVGFLYSSKQNPA